MPTVLLVRHGETHWNREERIQGWEQTSLTEHGRTQAIALGDALNETFEITQIYTSDLKRTRQTTSLIRRSVDAPLVLDAGWRERHFGCCQGLTYDEFTDEFPALSFRTNGEDAVTQRPMDGETLQETYQRVWASWTRVVSNADVADTVLIVSHGGPICLVLGSLADCTIPESYRSFRQDNCAVNEIHIGDNRTEIVRECDTKIGELPPPSRDSISDDEQNNP